LPQPNAPSRRYGFEGGLHVEGCHGFKALPDPCIVNGDLTIKGCPSFSELPATLRVSGNLRLIGIPLETLSRQLQVGGSLILECCARLTQLPIGMTVGRNLIVRRCPISAIPCGIRIGQSLKLFRCANLTSLPTGLVVPKVLDVRRCSSLAHFPAGLQIGFGTQRLAWQPALIVSDCLNVQTLPSDLKIQGPIDLAGSGITALPPSLASSRLLWRGIPVRPEVVVHPESLSAEEVLNEPNAEIRRIMLDRVGCEVLLAKAKARTVHQDTDAGGFRRVVDVQLKARNSSPIRTLQRFLECRCPSTGRVYLMRVPSELATCHAAAAWLAGFDNPDEYQPLMET
jgi:hypothetical protein